MSSLTGFFLNEKPVKVLIELKDSPGVNATRLAREADTTYAHTVKIVNFFEEEGLATRSVEGRCKPIRLTGEGREIAEHLEPVLTRFEPGKLENIEVETG